MLDALLEERSVARAASLLNLTPSAVSHSLRDLRIRFGDPLLVRAGNGSSPTPRAAALRVPLRQALSDLQRLLSEDFTLFDSAVSKRTFSLATPDYPLFTFLPELLRRLRTQAPGLNLKLLPLQKDMVSLLTGGEIDLILAGEQAEERLGLDRDVMRELVMSLPFQCVVSRNALVAAGGRLDQTTFAAMPHVFVSMAGGDRDAVDEALLVLGLRRRVLLEVPSFSAALRLVAHGDLVATIPAAVAALAADDPSLIVLAPPLPLPPCNAYMWWHPRYQQDQGHSWWRSTLLAVTLPYRES